MSESFAELFEQSLASQPFKPGAIITGLVVDVNEDVVIVNAGLKSEAVIPAEQFRDEQSVTRSKSLSTQSRTVSVRPACPATRRSAPAPGRCSKKPSTRARSSRA